LEQALNKTSASFAKPQNIPFSDNGDTINAQAFLPESRKEYYPKNFRGEKFQLFSEVQTLIFLRQIWRTVLSSISKSPLEESNLSFLLIGNSRSMSPMSFAGIEDKRMYPQTPTDGTKVLRIYGSMIFGGLEIKSF
jgi:hypothetical protein